MVKNTTDPTLYLLQLSGNILEDLKRGHGLGLASILVSGAYKTKMGSKRTLKQEKSECSNCAGIPVRLRFRQERDKE